jgi:ABC-type uncharacterized transport system involved in gliding motility auxiliary subunit
VRRYLAIPGALLLTVAFVRAATSARWDDLGVGLALAGAAIVLVATIWNRREVVEWIRDPRGVFAVTTGVSVAVSVALLVMVNIAAWYHPWSVDLTAAGRNRVSSDTQHLLERLATEVSLQQFGRTSDPMVDQLLQGFARAGRRVRVEFVDVDRDRDRATRYGVVKLGTVVVVAGEKFRKVEDANEQALVTAILQVTTSVERTLCFVTGHGERGLSDAGAQGLSQLAATLAASNYVTDWISLLEDHIPHACSVLVVAGPQEELSTAEIDRLQSYFEKQGRVALLLEPDPAASLAAWLHPLGVTPQAGAIVDTSGAGRSVGGGPRTPLALRYVDHPVTRGFEIATMYSGARPLQTIDRSEAGATITALAQTGLRSFATLNADPEPALQQGTDTPGPLTLATAVAVGSQVTPGNSARLVVFGDADFISNAFLRRQGNRDFFLRSLSWLIGEEEATVVSVDDRQNRRIELTERTHALMYIVNLGALPLIPLLAGVFVYLRSRR